MEPAGFEPAITGLQDRRLADLATTPKTVDRSGGDRTHDILFVREALLPLSYKYKGGCCQICGYDKCVRALSFHHLDAFHKDFNIGGKSKSWNTIQSELDKCILLCANCHAEVHAGLLIL
jgi:hypothetical protein